MKIIKTTDVWTEQYRNHYECFNGAFIDGIKHGITPYDSYKILLNCNCKIKKNTNEIIIGNKHNAIVFYKERNVIRLLVLTQNTDVLRCVENALNQKVDNSRLKDILMLNHVSQEIVDMKQSPIYNKNNGLEEMDIGSCDRFGLFVCMLRGDYTESETTFGNYDCNEYDYFPNIKITYNLIGDSEKFLIIHEGAFINKTKTRAIIVQKASNLSLDDLKPYIRQ